MKDTKIKEFEKGLREILLQAERLNGATVHIIYSEGVKQHALKVTPRQK